MLLLIAQIVEAFLHCRHARLRCSLRVMASLCIGGWGVRRKQYQHQREEQRTFHRYRNGALRAINELRNPYPAPARARTPTTGHMGKFGIVPNTSKPIMACPSS